MVAGPTFPAPSRGTPLSWLLLFSHELHMTSLAAIFDDRQNGNVHECTRSAHDSQPIIAFVVSSASILYFALLFICVIKKSAINLPQQNKSQVDGERYWPIFGSARSDLALGLCGPYTHHALRTLLFRSTRPLTNDQNRYWLLPLKYTKINTPMGAVINAFS